MAQNPVETKELVTATLKEYEGLRKEIDARTDATRVYGWPVVILAFGFIVGWQKEASPNMLNVALLFLPVVGMTIAALAANANYDMDKARWALAHTEDRIFRLTGYPALLNESRAIYDWRTQRLRTWLAWYFFVAMCYLILEVWLYVRLSKHFNDLINCTNYPERVFLAFAVIVAPLLLYLYNGVARYRLRSNSFDTALLRKLKAKGGFP